MLHPNPKTSRSYFSYAGLRVNVGDQVSFSLKKNPVVYFTGTVSDVFANHMNVLIETFSDHDTTNVYMYSEGTNVSKATVGVSIDDLFGLKVIHAA